MEKAIIDILLILILFGSAFLCIRLYLKNRVFSALLVIIGLGLILRGYLASQPGLNDWDEKYHALVAKNLVEHPTKPTLFDNPVLPFDENDWSSSHLWFSKPPMALWSIAGSVAIFGNHEYAVRLPSLIFSLIGIYLTFLIGKRLFNERVGLIAAFFHAINGILIELAAGRGSSDHVETLFIVMVEVAIYFSILSLQRKQMVRWTLLAGLFTGVAFLTKWFPAFIVFPVWLTGLIFSEQFSWKKCFGLGLLLLLSTAIVIFPWFSIVNSYGDTILQRVLFAFGTSIPGHARPFWYYFNELMITFGEMVFIPIIIALFHAAKGVKKQSLWILLIWILLPLIIFTLGATKRYTYIMISAPALFLIIAYFIDHTLIRFDTFKPKILAYIVVIGLVILPFRFTVERLKIFQEKPTLSAFYQHRENWKDRFDENDVVVNCPDNIDLMFYTDVKAAYAFMPTTMQLSDLMNQGHDVYVYREGQFIQAEH